MYSLPAELTYFVQDQQGVTVMVFIRRYRTDDAR